MQLKVTNKMKNKQLSKIIFLSIIVIGLSAFIVSLKQKSTENNPKEIKLPTQENQQNKETGKILLRARKTNSEIVLTLEPVNQPVYLRAFAMKAYIETNETLPKLNTTSFVAKDMSSQTAWIFPIKKLEINQKSNTIEINLSGFITGKAFYLEKGIPIVLIKLTESTGEKTSLKSFSTNNEVTRFLDDSAETIIYQTSLEN